MATLQMNFLSIRLGMQTNVSVFIPSAVPGRENPGRDYAALYPEGKKYRTLWLLPTEYGDDSEVMNYSAVLRFAQKYQFAVVFPCAYEKLYSNDPHGQRYSDYISEELFAVCTSCFPLSVDKKDHFIGGFSFGAYGAMKCALHDPENYAGVLMFGGAYEKDLKNGYLEDMRKEMALNGAVPQQPLDDAVETDTELILPEGIELPKVFLANALQAPLSAYVKRAEENLKKDGFSVCVYEKDAEDDWDFRDEAMKEAFAWLKEN